MEMPGSRRSNYTLLSQIPDETLYHQPPPKYSAASGGAVAQQPYYYESQSGEKNKFDSERAAAFDWDVIDQRMIQAQPRIGTTAFPGSIGLQRQSSGSSFGESSISGDYYIPSLSNPEGCFSHLSDGGSELRVKAMAAEAEASGRGDGSSFSSKSWAQQTEESYQLQLALALRLSSEASCADDPNLFDPALDESIPVASSSTGSAAAISHRFWVTQTNT